MSRAQCLYDSAKIKPLVEKGFILCFIGFLICKKPSFCHNDSTRYISIRRRPHRLHGKGFPNYYQQGYQKNMTTRHLPTSPR